MAESTVIQSGRPSEFSPDPLTEVIGSGARELPASAVQAEAADFLARHEHLVDERGRRRMVRHGTLPEREVMTVTGPVPVEVPRVRDRGAGVAAGGRIRFRSSAVPPYLRKTKSVEDLLPWLYPRGISTGGFGEAVAALPGSDAGGSPPPRSPG